MLKSKNAQGFAVVVFLRKKKKKGKQHPRIVTCFICGQRSL